MWKHFKQSLKVVLSAAMLAGAFMPLYAEESEEETIETAVYPEAAYVSEDEYNVEPADASLNASLSTVTLNFRYHQTEARSMLGMVNALRTGNEAWAWDSTNTNKIWYNNLSPLYYDYELEKVAMQRAAEIALEWGHYRPDGSYCTTAYPAAFNNTWRGECIAAGWVNSAASAYYMWEEKDYDYAGQAHRRNMLSPNFKAIGIGYAEYNGTGFWVQEFSSAYVNGTPVNYDENYRAVNVQIPSSSAYLAAEFKANSLKKDPSMIVEIGYPKEVPGVAVGLYYGGYSRSYAAIGSVIKSSNSSILKVENGKLVALKPGDVTVTFDYSCGSYRASKQLKVHTRKHEHDFRFKWLWSDDLSEAQADYICTVDDAHNGSGDAVVTSETKQPTCHEEGMTTYTATLNIEGKNYYDYRYVLIPPTEEHDYTEPEFEWSDDYSTVTAHAYCAAGGEEISETVNAVYEVIQQPTETEKGTGRFTAYFENDYFGTPSQDVEIPALSDRTPEDFTIKESSLYLQYDQQYRLNKTLSPANSDAKIYWISSDNEVASVDSEGKVTAHRAGTAVIRGYTLYGQGDACSVTVLFSDVSDTSRYFFNPVYWAADQGITVGHGGRGRFSPDATCTREQIVTFLWRLMGEPDPVVCQSFTDVKPTDWYFKPISWAAENGITVGLNDGTGRFGVGQPCTREQCVTFLYRAAGEPGYDGSVLYWFRDVYSGKYYTVPVRWAAEKGITRGLNDGTNRFGIGQACTRAMIVTFLKRYADLDSD